MARSRAERTTGLPRPRPRERSSAGEHRLGPLTWTVRQARFAILGAAVLLLLAILGGIAYNVYEENVARPNTVILTVGDDDYTLSYYADRLLPFLQQNSNSFETAKLAEEALLNKLEEEALILQVAKDKGIALSDQDVTQFIADSFGVPAGGSGSSFDTLYRNQLKTVGMSDANYRRMEKAALANTRLLDRFRDEVGASGEQLTLRTIVVASKEAADALLGRLQQGEDMGTVAQTESSDLNSRQQDGLMQPEPVTLLPDAVQKAVEGKQAGAEVFGAVQIQENWWIFRIEKREDTPYTDGQKEQLAQMTLDAAVAAKRAELASTLDRQLDADDIAWAEKHLN